MANAVFTPNPFSASKMHPTLQVEQFEVRRSSQDQDTDYKALDFSLRSPVNPFQFSGHHSGDRPVGKFTATSHSRVSLTG